MTIQFTPAGSLEAKRTFFADYRKRQKGTFSFLGLGDLREDERRDGLADFLEELLDLDLRFRFLDDLFWSLLLGLDPRRGLWDGRGILARIEGLDLRLPAELLRSRASFPVLTIYPPAGSLEVKRTFFARYRKRCQGTHLIC